jgi:hypothetical protein
MIEKHTKRIAALPLDGLSAATAGMAKPIASDKSTIEMVDFKRSIETSMPNRNNMIYLAAQERVPL